MDPARGPRPHDPDLDRPPSAPSARGEPSLEQEYQRLVANPFLALAAFFLWLDAARRALLARNLVFVLLLLAALATLAALLQFHCLDCGATDLLFRWKRHVCHHALARQSAGRRRWLRGPNPATQTLLWIYVVAIASLLAALTWHARH